MKKLMLWCSPEHAPPPRYFTLYWAQYISGLEREKGNISLPEMINDNVSYWKPRYLSWLESVGKIPYGSTTVVDALLIRPGLSYWWLTVPSDYSFSTKSTAYATIRLWALVQIADDHHVKELEVHDADAELEEVLTLWCNGTGRQITFVRGHTTNKNESQIQTTLSYVKTRLPPLINGISYLSLQYLRYFTWRRHKLSSETVDDLALTVVDYFASLDVQAAQAGTYTSNYWGPLTQILPLLGKTVNWIHVDVPSEAFPDVRSARAAIRGLNKGNRSSNHVLIHDYLTLRVVFKAVAQYMRMRRITRQVLGRLLWEDAVSGLDVGPLVKSRLHADLWGTGAAKNSLWLSLFEEALPSPTSQDACIYLMENQPWELALLHEWTIRGGGPTVGVAHVPVRTWDFRYALGSSTLSKANMQSLPRPSQVAVIDPASEDVMIANGLEPSEIVKVEGLRFLSRASTATTASYKRAAVRVLVFGEYDAQMCAKQLQLLEELASMVSDNYTFTFRPHPVSGIRQWNLPVGVSLSRALSVGKDLAECDVVICSNVSSASLDASLIGIPILMLRDGRVFNGSPLIAGLSVTYVNEAAEVISALSDLESGGGGMPFENKYPMYLDSGVTRWRHLLDSLMGNESK
jgi:surface carbohydrate biosynthesis protein (TIGR04326 family)